MKKIVYAVLGSFLLFTFSGYAKSFIIVSTEESVLEAKNKKKICTKLLNMDKNTSFDISIESFDKIFLVKIGSFNEDNLFLINYLKIKDKFPKAFIFNTQTPILLPNSEKVKIVEKKVYVDKKVVLEKEDNTLWIALFGLAIIGILYMFLSSDQIKRLKASQLRMKKKHKALEEKQHSVLSSMGENIHTIAKETMDQTSKLVEKAKETHLHDEIKKVMHNETELLDVTGDLIKFLQLKSKKVVVHNEVFNFNNVLNEIIGLLSESAKQYQVELIFDIDKSVPYRMLADSSHLGQILVNLLEYYVQYTVNSKVRFVVNTMSSLTEGLKLKINIEGDLQINNKEKFFDTYYDEETRRYSGLGLFVAKELIDLMEGEVSIYNFENRDNLQIILPIEELSKERRKYRLSNKHIMDSSILIVENDIDAALALEKRFAYFKIETKVEQAEYFMQHIPNFKNYNIVILDRELFNRKIISIFQQVKQNSGLKIIALESLYKTYDTSLPDIVDSVMDKPFSPEYIFETLERLQDNQKKTLKNRDKRKQVQLPIHRDPFQKKVDLILEQFSYFSGKSLLLVEDNIINQKVIQNILAKSNMEIYLAINGEEALNFLYKNPNQIDFILMDINMPVLDGFSTTEKIRQEEIFDHIPIVSLTALVADHEIEKMFKVGMNGYLSKPIIVEKLYTALNVFLGDKSHQKSIEINMPIEPINLLGLSVQEGLSYMQNNNIFYKEVLREFMDAYAKSDTVFESLILEKRYEQVKMLCLDMKGLTGTIGAKDMFELINEIHQYLLYNKPELVDNYVKKYKKELKILRESIQIYLDVY